MFNQDYSMKIGCCWAYAIAKYGYPPPIGGVLKAASEVADLGFGLFELEAIEEKNLKEIEADAERIAEHYKKAGVKITNFSNLFRDIINQDHKKRKTAIENFSKGVELAKFFGADTVMIDTWVPPLRFIDDVPYKDKLEYGKRFTYEVDPDFRWSVFWDLLVGSITECNRIAKSKGLKLCIEPRVGENISNTDAILRLMDEVDSDNFGAVLDTAHLHAQKETLPLSVEKLGEKIFIVHVSDNDNRENYHLALGQGTIDWKGLFKALAKYRYNGPVLIDIIQNGFTGSIEQEYINAREFLLNLGKKIGIKMECPPPQKMK